MTPDERDDRAPREQGGAGREAGADGERGADAGDALAQLRAVHAVDLGYEMLAGLAGFAGQKLGLTPATRPIRDLADARLAIELMRAGVEVVEREVGRPRATELRHTLAQLQLAYARVASEAAGPAAGTADGVATGPDGGSGEAAGGGDGA